MLRWCPTSLPLVPDIPSKCSQDGELQDFMAVINVPDQLTLEEGDNLNRPEKKSHGVYILEFILVSSNQRGRESQSTRKFWCTTPGLRWRRPLGKIYGPPLEAESGLQVTTSKEMRTSVLQPPWSKFYQTRMSLQKESFPESLDKNSIQVTPSTLNLLELWAGNPGTLSLGF